MKRFLTTLYGKISLIFLLLLIVLGAIQIMITVRAAMTYECESSQRLNSMIARNLARRLQPYTRDTIDTRKIQTILEDLSDSNPHLEVYLVDTNGKILSFFNKSRRLLLGKIDINAVKQFLGEYENKNYPIWGTDPTNPDRPNLFTADKIEIMDNPGYLYIILGGERHLSFMSGLKGSKILSTSVIVLFITSFIGAALGMILLFFVTKRLHKLTSAVKNFESGEYNKRVTIKSGDEVGQLGAAFNHMAQTIENNLKELKENDELRRQLIANISHDLRSPLTSIQGYLETILMREDKYSDSEKRRFLQITLKNVTNLTKLVQQLFELSILDAQQKDPIFEPFSINELFHDILLKFKPQADEANIKLISNIPENFTLTIGDVGMIERVLTNLIGNALKFTPAGGEIRANLSMDEKNILVKISDTGRGIPKEDLPYVFDRFYRVEKSRTAYTQGSGLGLAIVKKIIDTHKTTITVESVEGQGTTFMFTLKKYSGNR